MVDSNYSKLSFDVFQGTPLQFALSHPCTRNAQTIQAMVGLGADIQPVGVSGLQCTRPSLTTGLSFFQSAFIMPLH